MKNLSKTIALVLLLLVSVRCDLIDAQLDNPNALSPEQVNPDFLLNNIQQEARNVYNSAAGIGAGLTRMRHLGGGTFDATYSPESFNTIYSNAYADQFIDTKTLIPIAKESGLFFHAGIAYALQAYSMLAIVDMFGDMPYSEALDETNLNPGLDEGASIYSEAIALLDSAIANLENPNRTAVPDNDFYYSGDSDSWVRFANTVKLKAYLNTGNTEQINQLIDAGNLIDDPEFDFVFQYSTNDANPDSRHPLYASNYDNGAGSYMAINFMNMLLNDKADNDPRLRYYIYRQTTTDPTASDINLKTCVGRFYAGNIPPQYRANDPYCLLGDGWWGRDYLNNEGIPPDGFLRSTFGVYPVGGNFDRNAPESVAKGDGLAGAGFRPILLSSFTWFMIAEAELTLNNDPAAARVALETAINQSFDKVADFGAPLAAGTPFEITSSNTGTYISEVLDRWDNDTGKPTAESSTDYKLRNIVKEYYLALWPNGYEAYNAMRRTGYPDREDNLQPSITQSPGDWYRMLLKPADMVERNSSVDQITDRLMGPFWDPMSGSEKFNF